MADDNTFDPDYWQEVTLGNRTVEVAYDEDADEVQLRDTLDDLKHSMVVQADDWFDCVSFGEVDRDTYQEYADRMNYDVVEVTVTPDIFLEFAEDLAEYADDTGQSAVTLTVAHDMPMVAEFGATDLLMIPRRHDEEDEYHDRGAYGRDT